MAGSEKLCINVAFHRLVGHLCSWSDTRVVVEKAGESTSSTWLASAQYSPYCLLWDVNTAEPHRNSTFQVFFKVEALYF
jgi:hypothetical protein